MAANISSSSTTAEFIENILGIQGTAKDGMLKFVIGRKVKMPCGCVVGKEMAINTWAAFMGSDHHAVVDGDFATSEGEWQAVLKSLRHSGINMVAIHSHMEGEVPRLIFLHFCGIGTADRLARGFKSALDVLSAIAKTDQ